MTHPLGEETRSTDEDPRLWHIEMALGKLWDDEDLTVPSDRLMALTAIEEADRWDRENGIQRVTETLVRSLSAQLSATRGALMAAVLAFESCQEPLVAVDALDPDEDIRLATPSIPVPLRTIERWRIIAEGGQG